MNARCGNLPRKTDTTALFERFPHLQGIDLIWGTRECRQYISNLMTDTRGGKRQGFPAEHAMTIMRLLMEHDNLYPQFENEPIDLRWGDGPMRRTGGR